MDSSTQDNAGIGSGRRERKPPPPTDPKAVYVLLGFIGGQGTLIGSSGPVTVAQLRSKGTILIPGDTVYVGPAPMLQGVSTMMASRKVDAVLALDALGNIAYVSWRQHYGSNAQSYSGPPPTTIPDLWPSDS